MKFNKIFSAVFLVGMLMLTSAIVANAQEPMNNDGTTKKDGNMMKEDTRPVVAVIKAEWCPYCKRIDPVVGGLMKDYAEKLNFVVFDVTNAKTTAESKAMAEKLGMTKFFNEYKGKTSTVAVLKDKKVVYKTSNNGEKADYVEAFDKALEN